MQDVLHHVALALAVLALAAVALRVASTVTPSGLERALAAVVLGAAAAVLQALGLGLVALGGSTVALLVATAALWVAARAWLPPPSVRPATELADWWRGLGAPARVAAAALAGAGVAWIAWQLRYPAIGFDSSVYHYPEVAAWIANGRPGSIISLNYDMPYGNYPLTDEVAQTWGAAIARSWMPIALWSPAMAVTLAAAAWQTLRNLSVSRAAAGLGTAALVVNPLVVRQLNEAQTDLPAMTWLTCTGALALAAGRRPALLAPAIVAAGLAIGTKPTTAPMAVVALSIGIYQARGRLRPLAGWLGLAFGGAFAVGGVWYARNLLEHGWPLWPFAAGPWGDPLPRFMGLIDTTFIERPVATLDGRLGEYSSRLAGALAVLLGAFGALVVGALARLDRDLRRPLVVAGAMTLLAVVAWSFAWATGLQREELPGAQGWSLSAIRYMLPAIGAAIVAVGLASRVPGWVGRAATGVLAVALVWSVVADARLGAPWTPQPSTLLLGALGGLSVLGIAVVVWRLRASAAQPTRVLPGNGLAVVAAAAFGVLLAPVSNGYIERYTKVSQSTAPGSDVVAWFLTQPGFEDGDDTIAFASRAAFGPLVGDHFQHRIELIPRRARCRDVARLAARQPVLIVDQAWFRGILGVLPYGTGRCLARRRPAYVRYAYAVYQPERTPRIARSAPHE